jgi:hypothetical protein
MVFKNEAQLKKFLISKCVKAVDNTERKVHEELAGNLNQFYTEFHPVEYERTGALFGALESTGTMQTGNGAMAEVYFNTPSYNTGTWSGDTVLKVAMESGVPHGGYAGGTAVWTESMEKLGGKSGINSLLRQELKKQGL